MSQFLNKYVVIGSSAVALIGLLVKNYFEEKSTEILSKDDIVHILKCIRKNNYPLLKKVTMAVIQIRIYFPGNLTPEMLQQILNGPESGLFLEQKIEAVISDVCKQNNTDPINFDKSRMAFAGVEDIQEISDQIDKDMEDSYAGKQVAFEVDLPADLTKEKVTELLNKSLKIQFLFQVEMIRKMKHLSMEEIQNPEIANSLGDPNNGINEMLENEGLGSQYVPAQAVLASAIQKYTQDKTFGRIIAGLEQNYNRIFSKYGQKIQMNTMTEADLIRLEEEINSHSA